jgi:hypothetical protein
MQAFFPRAADRTVKTRISGIHFLPCVDFAVRIEKDFGTPCMRLINGRLGD